MSDGAYGFDNRSSILLGDYLDLILNTTGRKDPPKEKASKFLEYVELAYTDGELENVSGEKDEGHSRYEGGIRLPHKADDYDVKQENDDGSGNIVIVGEPGVGKSTLAFQIAAECTSMLNNGIAIYYSIDITRSQLIKSMCKTEDDTKTENGEKDGGEANGRKDPVRMSSFQGRDANDSDGNLKSELKKALGMEPHGGIQPQVLLPMLSPRGVSLDHRYAQDLFRERFSELELMLRAICAYNREISDILQRQKRINDKAARESEKNKAKAQCGGNREPAPDVEKQEDFRPLDAEELVVSRNPMIKLVVIDSINMLGEIPLTREQVSLVFELFESYGVLGLFTLGENTAQTDAEAVNSATVKYIADLVLQLKREEHNNYTCMTMTVVKSRFIKTLIGAHPYKIVEPEIVRLHGNGLNIRLKKRVNVMATLHDIIPGTEGSGPDGSRAKKEDNLFGIPELCMVLPDQFGSRKGGSSQTITLMGGNGLFKSDLAVNAILNGLVADTPKTGLIIRMSDRESFQDAGTRLEEHVLRKILQKKHGKPGEQASGVTADSLVNGEGDLIVSIGMDAIDEKKLVNTVVPIKRKVSGWCISKAFIGEDAAKQAADAFPVEGCGKSDSHAQKLESGSWAKKQESDSQTKMLEVVFKSGALLPEEFIADVMMLVIRHNVKLIAFHDIKYIGTSYPFLIDSGTSGTLFISAFIHIMRNYGVDVIMTSSECDFEPSDFEMKKTVALSDALLRFERKPENGVSVVISGEGQMIHNQWVEIQVLNGKQKAPKGKQRVIHTSFHIYKRDRDGKVMESKDTALLNAFSITAQARPSESETRQLTDQ